MLSENLPVQLHERRDQKIPRQHRGERRKGQDRREICGGNRQRQTRWTPEETQACRPAAQRRDQRPGPQDAMIATETLKPGSLHPIVRRPSTVFNDENKKWKPRNKQAAFVVRKASESLLHTPPPKTEATHAPTQDQRVAEYRAMLKRRIADAEEWRRNRPPRAQRKAMQREQFMAAQKRRAMAAKRSGSDTRKIEP